MRVSKCFACAVAVVLAVLMVGSAMAQQISVNFSENSANQGFAGGQLIGPLNSDSANWNNTNGQPTLASGALAGLIDDAGAATGASMTWSSSNCWYNADGTGDDQHKMAVGYLDDGGNGVNVTVSGLPYADYLVYLLVASDQGAGAHYDSQDFMVNGTWVLGGANPVASWPAYNTIGDANTEGGSFWVQADGATRGNYLVASASGSTLEIQGLPRNGSIRGSLTGIIIAQVPEPGSLFAALGGLGLLMRRRRNAR